MAELTALSAPASVHGTVRAHDGRVRAACCDCDNSDGGVGLPTGRRMQRKRLETLGACRLCVGQSATEAAGVVETTRERPPVGAQHEGMEIAALDRGSDTA